LRSPALRPGRWLRLRYRTGFFDDPVRPLIMMRTAAGGEIIEPMNGAAAGLAEWLGFLPADALSVSISPACRPGSFAFEILSLESLSDLGLAARTFRREPKRAVLAGAVALVGMRGQALLHHRYAAPTPFDAYDDWHAAHAREPELDGFDAPRTDWRAGPCIAFVAGARGASPGDLNRTLASLKQQAYPHWRLGVVHGPDDPDDLVARLRHLAREEPRLVALLSSDRLTVLEANSPELWLGPITLGDLIPPLACGMAAERIARGDLDVVYGDEDAVAADGRLHSPRFKPDWSPRFFAETPFVGRPVLAGRSWLGAIGFGEAGHIVDEAAFAERALGQVARVGHLRRVLYRRFTEPDAQAARSCRRAAAYAHEHPPVAAIIPSRDRADLLARCVDGLLNRTDYPGLEVLVVDNGSVAPDAKALLARLDADPRVRVLAQPGPFNYSALCNAGAGATTAPVLLFLNNDTDVIAPDWLRKLAPWTLAPDVGAVGAKLLYGDGRVQHAGVTLGVGGLTRLGAKRRARSVLQRTGRIRPKRPSS
jgi:hypothetical protein